MSHLIDHLQDLLVSWKQQQLDGPGCVKQLEEYIQRQSVNRIGFLTVGNTNLSTGLVPTQLFMVGEFDASKLMVGSHPVYVVYEEEPMGRSIVLRD